MEDVSQLVELVGNVAPVVGKVLTLIGAVVEQAAMATANKRKCQSIAGRVKNLEQPLTSCVAGCTYLMALEFQETCADLHPANACPIAESVMRTLVRAISFVQKYGDMCRFRQFVAARSIKSKFERLAREIDSALQDVTFFINVQTRTQIELASMSFMSWIGVISSDQQVIQLSMKQDEQNERVMATLNAISQQVVTGQNEGIDTTVEVLRKDVLKRLNTYIHTKQLELHLQGMRN